MLTSRHVQFTAILLFFVMALVWGRPVSAQCSVPAGWQLYTVVRGDNLYRIALRFGTTTSVLQSSNCLKDTRINAGQTLYVPQGTGAATPVPNNTVMWRTEPATFQPFERGFMIWLARTGDIWVYSQVNTGVKSRNRLDIHPVSQYGSLRASSGTAPAGLIMPVFGFGKVWSNLNSYRSTLGWAIQSESAYTLRFGILNGQTVEFNLADGRSVTLQSDGFWSEVTGSTPSAQSVNIDSPASSTSLPTGQSFTATGRAAGLFEASFVLELHAVPSETLLANAIITYNAPEVGQPGTWQQLLTPLNYTGAAELRAIYIRPSDGVQVVLARTPLTFR